MQEKEETGVSKRGKFRKEETTSGSKAQGRKKSRRTRGGKRKDYSDELPKDEAIDKSKYTHGHNDLRWLLHNPDLAKVASRVPFGTPIGYRIPMIKATAANQGTPPDPDTVIPGILRIDSLLTAGVAKDINSPINQAALNLWTFLRHSGTGSLVDDPNDVAFYFMGIAQLLAFIGWMKRVAGELVAVNDLNRYVRRGLVYAEGLDYNDMVNHLSEFLFYITWFCAQVNNFVFPKLPYFDQAYTAFHYVYKDELHAKSQLYIFSPRGFGVLDFTSDEEGTMMKYCAPYIDSDDWSVDDSAVLEPGMNLKFEGLKALGNMMLGILLNEQSVATLSAAVLKAYGAEGLWRVTDLDSLHQELECVVDPELMMQIHNIQVGDFGNLYTSEGSNAYFYYSSKVPTPGSGQAPYIVTNDNAYFVVPAVSVANTYRFQMKVSMYFDLFTEVPSEGEVILASRLKVRSGYGVENEGQDYTVNIESCDAILPLGFSVITMVNGSPSEYDITQELWSAITYNEDNTTEFDASPILWRFYGINTRKPKIVGEIHNFTTVDDKVISDLHLNNLLSLFDVPKFQ